MRQKLAIFVAHRNSLREGGGGQQICTNEYLRVLREIYESVEVLDYEHDQSLGHRLRLKLGWCSGYSPNWERDLPARVARVAQKNDCPIFLNLNDLLPLGPLLRGILGTQQKIVLLSHGLRSVEAFHHQRIGRLPGLTPSIESRANVGRLLRDEGRYLSHFDLVVSLAPFEEEICRWLGARRACWLPRIVEPNPIPWQPVGGRLGLIGTMNHAPNAEGVLRWLEALQPISPAGLRVRLISHSGDFCRYVAKHFPCVDYLGPLSNAEAQAEAGTWNAFVHPQFCYAMGCSTKLATGLSWGLPCLTTPAGARGYRLATTAGVVVDGSCEDLARASVESAMAPCPRGLDLNAVRCPAEFVVAVFQSVLERSALTVPTR
jgi:hypothetical protein